LSRGWNAPSYARWLCVALAAAVLAWGAGESWQAARAHRSVEVATSALQAWRDQPPRGVDESSLWKRLQDAEALEADNPATQELLGLLAVRRHEDFAMLEQAIARFERSLAARPVSPITWANLAAARYQVGDTGPAFRAALRNAARLGPSHPGTQRLVAFHGLAVLDEVDAETRRAVEAMVAAAQQAGGVDILVNNAGITRDQLMLRMKREDWDAVLATNLTAAFTTSQAVLRPMIKQRRGRIINITSVVGQSGNAGQANYAASKAGLIGFTKALAQEVASRHVTVNAVAPGLIETDMTRAIADDAHKTWAEKIPLGRLGTPDDIAAAVCFLASDEASYITGHVLAVNGGMYM